MAIGLYSRTIVPSSTSLFSVDALVSSNARHAGHWKSMKTVTVAAFSLTPASAGVGSDDSSPSGMFIGWTTVPPLAS